MSEKIKSVVFTTDQFVDKGNRWAKMTESFSPPFSKGGAVESRNSRRRPQSAKFPSGDFFLPSFFFAPAWSKKKRVSDLYDLPGTDFSTGFVSSLNRTVFDRAIFILFLGTSA